MNRNYDVITFILKYFYFKGLEQLLLLTLSKLQPCSFQKSLKTQKLEGLKIINQNAIYICIS